MTGQLPALDFVLAENLGLTLAQVRAMPNAEIVEWECFYRYRDAMRAHEANKSR